MATVAKVAVQAATYAIDKVYDYLLPPELAGQVGCRVLVPFGRGNRLSEAVILSLRQEVPDKPLKAVRTLLDEEPILTEKELRLTRVFAVILPLGALFIALYIKNAYNILMFAWSFYAAAAGLPAFAALYWKKATKAGTLAGMGAGFSVPIVWKLLGQPFGLGATVPGAIACALARVLVSLATCKKHPSTFLDPREKAAA